MRGDRKSSNEGWCWFDGCDLLSALFEIDALAIPLLIAMLVGLIISFLWWLLVGRRRKLRERCCEQGLCADCGYDLRASTDRCPECGTPIPQPRASIRPRLARS